MKITAISDTMGTRGRNNGRLVTTRAYFLHSINAYIIFFLSPFEYGRRVNIDCDKEPSVFYKQLSATWTHRSVKTFRALLARFITSNDPSMSNDFIFFLFAWEGTSRGTCRVPVSPPLEDGALLLGEGRTSDERMGNCQSRFSDVGVAAGSQINFFFISTIVFNWHRDNLNAFSDNDLILNL